MRENLVWGDHQKVICGWSRTGIRLELGAWIGEITIDEWLEVGEYKGQRNEWSRYPIYISSYIK